eukprot:TRINITY_DN1431_c0_g2_i1.p1 TRINITY_DN1431_c0_g2~~TRINITY_DN1431_c0_g2_i1.p1  ORF type:complete len:473 (-),score=139.33 TRINITY_DN1431_c0_g2_i1:91-1473(-)
MGDVPKFEFLGAWGIQLNAKGSAEVAEFADSHSRKHVEDYVTNADIRKLGINGSLPRDIPRLTGTVPAGNYLVQVQKIVDITQPAKFQEDFEGGKWRLLKLDLSDGDQKFAAVEYGSIKALGVQVPPGTKLLLKSSEKKPLKVQNGHLLLTQEVVDVMGGHVDKLVESWRASKEVEESRLLWRTEGVKKKAGVVGAPQWVDFDPKKASRGGRGGAAEKLVDDERKEWRSGGSTKLTQSKAAEVEEDKGPRFQMETFSQEDHGVKSFVSSNTFKKDEGKGKGKGKKGREEGGGGRWGRGGNDDWEPEKRAPTEATACLAAFIKPSKTSDASAAALAAEAAPAATPVTAAAASSAAGGGGGGAASHGWADDGWGGGNWDAGGAGGWNANDWSSGGGGGSNWSGGGGGNSWSSTGGGKSGGKRGGSGKSSGGKGGGGKGGGGKGGSRGGKGGGKNGGGGAKYY